MTISTLVCLIIVLVDHCCGFSYYFVQSYKLDYITSLEDARVKYAKDRVVSQELDRMIDIKRDILMYGSDNVFETFNKWLLASNGINSKEQFSAFLDFVHEMRKDLCNNKTRLNKHDLLLNLTQNEEEARKLYE